MAAGDTEGEIPRGAAESRGEGETERGTAEDVSGVAGRRGDSEREIPRGDSETRGGNGMAETTGTGSGSCSIFGRAGDEGGTAAGWETEGAGDVSKV